MDSTNKKTILSGWFDWRSPNPFRIISVISCAFFPMRFPPRTLQAKASRITESGMGMTEVDAVDTAPGISNAVRTAVIFTSPFHPAEKKLR